MGVLSTRMSYPAFVKLRIWRDLILLTLAGLLVHLFFLPNPGHLVDMQTFGKWALAAADHPWNQAYEATDMNYPPASLLIFELIGRGYRALVTNDPNQTLLLIAVKLPNVIFDLLGGLITYAVARTWVSHLRALLAMSLFLFNPAIVYDSALWGQNDTITTVSALASVWCVMRGQRILGWLALAFAALNKPPVIVLAPLFILEIFTTDDAKERKRRAIAGVQGVLGGLALAKLSALPFYTQHSTLEVFARMWWWLKIGASLYPYTSANAFNLHALYGDFFIPDTKRALFLSIKAWGNLAFIGVAIYLYQRYLRNARKALPGAHLLESAFLVMLAFFLTLTEMHERYLIYALTFLPALTVLGRTYLWSWVALTLTEWLNLEYAMTYMWINYDKPAGVNPKEFAPVLARLCATTNLGVFLASAWRSAPPAAIKEWRIFSTTI